MGNCESYLAVGQNVLLSPYGGKESTVHYRVVLRGWQVGSWMWLEVPEDCEKLPLLLEDHTCVLRFMKDGQACACTARILQAMNPDGATRFSGMRVSWPEHIKTVEVRKSPRVSMVSPCQVTLPSGHLASCELRDLSEGGCSIAWMESRRAPTEGQLKLSFTLPGGIAVDKVLVTIRSVREVASVRMLGCQFEQIDEIVQNNIRLAIVSSVESMRTKQIERAVILDSNHDAVRPLVAALREEQFEVVVVSHLLEAAFWMESARPHALFIGHKQSELAVDQICRIVRETPNLEDLSVFVYGGEDTDLGRKVKRAGATDYFSSATTARGAVTLLTRGVTHSDAAAG
ncbi:MAG: PilZ domain-containing protein [Candidatus Hydrogenedentes bacterium]|nr:PilZ domain-containing protein [Candidatus Hydrogenedentota bacterium]